MPEVAASRKRLDLKCSIARPSAVPSFATRCYSRYPPKLSGSSPRPAARRGWANVLPPTRTFYLPPWLARSSLFLLRGLLIMGLFRVARSPRSYCVPRNASLCRMHLMAEK
jgi:hypothetical protein